MSGWDLPITKTVWAVIARSLAASIARASGLPTDDAREYVEFGMAVAARRYDRRRSGSPGMYIRAKGRLLALDELRKDTHGRLYDRVTKAADLSGAHDYLLPSTQPPAGLAEQGEAETIIRRGLSGEPLLVILLHYFGGLNFRTIGKLLDMTEGDAFYIHGRALDHVRRELGRYLLGMNHRGRERAPLRMARRVRG